MSNYDEFREGRVPIKAWTRGVAMEEEARKQLRNISQLPIVFHHVAVMPDVHFGIGATVGSVVPTQGAIIPAAVGVDIGCGVVAMQTTLPASQLPDSLKSLRSAIEKAVPHGRTSNGGRGDRGAWHKIPKHVEHQWKKLSDEYKEIGERHAKLGEGNDVNHLGTLGTLKPLHRGLSRRDGSRLVHAALRLARRGQPHRHVLHRAREEGHARLREQPAGRGSRVLHRGHVALR
jgi:tRNA-splicing ligase RtcB